MPYKALCLEHFKAKLGNDQTITLTRSFKVDSHFKENSKKKKNTSLCTLTHE